MAKVKPLSREEYEPIHNQLYTDGCPFCDLSKQLVIKKYPRWAWIANLSPLRQYQTLFIPWRHITRMSDLTYGEWDEYKEILKKAREACVKAGIKHIDGSPIYKYETRVSELAQDNVKPKGKLIHPEHLHIHFYPDIEGMYDPIRHKDAHTINVQGILKKHL